MEPLEQELINLSNEIEDKLLTLVPNADDLSLSKLLQKDLADFYIERHLITEASKQQPITSSISSRSKLYEKLLENYDKFYSYIHYYSEQCTLFITKLIQQYCSSVYNIAHINRALVDIFTKFDRARADIVYYIYDDLVKEEQDIELNICDPILTKLDPQLIQTMLYWLGQHLDSPYPTEYEKITFAKQFGVSLNCVNQWFSIKRLEDKVQIQFYLKQLQPQPQQPVAQLCHEQQPLLSLYTSSTTPNTPFSTTPASPQPLFLSSPHVSFATDYQQLQLELVMQQLCESLKGKLTSHLNPKQIAALGQNKKAAMLKKLGQLKNLVSSHLADVQNSKQLFQKYSIDLQSQLQQFHGARSEASMSVGGHISFTESSQMANYPLVSLFSNNNPLESSLQFTF
jgi:hypothetical protein